MFKLQAGELGLGLFFVRAPFRLLQGLGLLGMGFASDFSVKGCWGNHVVGFSAFGHHMLCQGVGS